MPSRERRPTQGSRTPSGNAVVLALTLCLAFALVSVTVLLTRSSGEALAALAADDLAVEPHPAAPLGDDGDSKPMPGFDLSLTRTAQEPSADLDPPNAGLEDAAGECDTARGAPAREARSEGEYFSQLCDLSARDPLAFRARAESVLSSDGPACEKVALLRAAFAGALPECTDWVRRALLELPDESGPQGESVPSTAILWLGSQAERSERARTLLADLAWSGERPALPSKWRRRVLHTLARATPDESASELRRRIARDVDPAVRDIAVLDQIDRETRRQVENAALEDP